MGPSMGFHLSLLLLMAFHPAIWALKVDNVIILVNGTEVVASTDANYVCATIDWWPSDKCNYNQCPWGSSSIINLDLSHPILVKAIQAFKYLRIRIGGSLQDEVLYDVGNLKSPCHAFRQTREGLLGFSEGCLHMDRWDEVNHFFSKAGVLVTFGLNALYGRHEIKKGVWGGIWDSSNAYDFIKYTISKAHQIDSWEFGNELSGKGIGASVDAEQYGKDLIKLRSIIDELYKNFKSKPQLAAPGGFYDEEWYKRLLQITGPHVINAITHHIYNLGAGVDHSIANRILDPHHLNKISETFSNLKKTIQRYGPWASAWVGESGGAYNNGVRGISNTFVDNFWYLDQLGMAAKYDTRVYCRQTFIGGNYGLLNTTTFLPNPDYYSALLWHRLMGKEVLAVTASVSSYLRTYAHCAKERAGITLLVINLSNQTEFDITFQNGMKIDSNMAENAKTSGRSFVHGLKSIVSWVGTKASDGAFLREEYHLTPKDGNLQSKIMLLNGKPLELMHGAEIPHLNPVLVDINSRLSIAPLSIKFVVFPSFNAPCCK